MHQFDWELFKAERRIKRKQHVTLDSLFYSIPYYDKKEVLTTQDLLDEIENEKLFHYLIQIDQLTLTIVLMKILGYTTNEISEKLNISSSSIYHRIHRLKNIIFNGKNQ